MAYKSADGVPCLEGLEAVRRQSAPDVDSEGADPARVMLKYDADGEADAHVIRGRSEIRLVRRRDC
jgi:hypothetical protein